MFIIYIYMYIYTWEFLISRAKGKYDGGSHPDCLCMHAPPLRAWGPYLPHTPRGPIGPDLGSNACMHNNPGGTHWVKWVMRNSYIHIYTDMGTYLCILCIIQVLICISVYMYGNEQLLYIYIYIQIWVYICIRYMYAYIETLVYVCIVVTYIYRERYIYIYIHISK